MNGTNWFYGQPGIHSHATQVSPVDLSESAIRQAIARAEGECLRQQRLAGAALSETVKKEHIRRAAEANREVNRLDALLPGRPCSICGDKGCTGSGCDSDARMEAR